ncbi:MAG: hypothetical protein JRJ19_14180, partial [Deltaproteobacteria bacterium]|nr:hypothetical protein [Deltaproteobacteria bacterium]
MSKAVVSCLIVLTFCYSGSQTRAEELANQKIKWLAVMVLPGVDLSPTDRMPVQDMLNSYALRHSGDDLDWQLLAYSPLQSPLKEAEILAEVSRNTKEGKKAYQYLKLPEAQAIFKTVAGALQNLPPAQCDRAQIAEMYLYWARATLDAGDDDRAQELLANIGRFDPESGPDPAVMPPNLVAVYDITLEDVRKKPESKVIVEITPGRGSLFIDCQSKPAGVVEIKGPANSQFWLAAQIESGFFRGSFAFHAGVRRHLKIFSPRQADQSRMADHLLKLGRANPSIGMLKAADNADLDQLAEILHVDIILAAEIRKSTDGKVVRLGLYVPAKGIVGTVHDVKLNSAGSLDEVALSNTMKTLAKLMKSPTLLAAV